MAKNQFLHQKKFKTMKNAIFRLKKKTIFLDSNYTFFHVSGHSAPPSSTTSTTSAEAGSAGGAGGLQSSLWLHLAAAAAAASQNHPTTIPIPPVKEPHRYHL